MALDLTDPATEPNPQIAALMLLSHKLFALSIELVHREVRVAVEYALAADHITQALGHLFEAKNYLAGE